MSVVSESRKISMKAYYDKHKETIIKNNKKYQKEHQEFYDNYNKAHREEHKEYRKAYYQEHKEQIKEYREEHKEEIKEYNRKRREIKYTCECGAECLIQHKNRHLDTKKHLKYLEKK